MRNRSWIAGLLLVLVACGHSEDEWQAQLHKYEELSAQNKKEQDARAATQAELEKTASQVEALKEQLQKMGVNLETVNQQLEQTGTQNKALTKNVEELARALDEYKARAAQLERIRARFEQLRDKLKKLTDLGLKVEIRRNRMVIRLPGDVLFASGEDKLRDQGKKVLGEVADVIRMDKQLAGRYFQVAGHTDNKPLSGGRFGDNWGLSVMRARQVLLYLIAPLDPKTGGGGLDPLRLHAAGYGETDPVGKNDSDESRQQNRRVELVLMPDVEEMLDLKSLI
ncbi:MAG TPA: flagellar motor protein MotB [Polyangiaceae bacterium]|nr:flagellar motor protein MotB [Polyangiaceae bacterium]